MDDDLQFSLDDIDAMMGQGANADENVQLSVEKEAEEEEPEEEEEDEELEDEMEEDEGEVGGQRRRGDPGVAGAELWCGRVDGPGE